MFHRVLSLVVLVIGITSSAHSQSSYTPPGDVQLQTKEDYARYEPDVVAASKWLEQTPLDQEPEKRKLANSFIVKWVSGSPTVSMEISQQLLKLYGKNTDLLGSYMASFGAYAIAHPGNTAPAEATKAGIKSMIKSYSTGTGIVKNKEMDKVSAMSDSELDQYVKRKF